MNAIVAVIDTDPSILDSMRLLLESRGWDVCTYTDADTFLKSFRFGGPCDVLLLDPHLPDTDGLEVVLTLAGRVPVVVLTARPHGALVDAMRRIGVDAVVAKPVEADDMTGVIADLLADRERTAPVNDR